MIDNPFTYGNPVSEPNQFFGRAREIRHVVSRLRSRSFGSSSLVGERRVGKTSLLEYLQNPTIRQAQGLGSDKYLFVYIDLQESNEGTTPVRLWQLLLEKMALASLDNEIKRSFENTSKLEHIDAHILKKLFEKVKQEGLRIVLLLDEFDHITRNKNFGPDFFYNLRSLATSRCLSLITSSRRMLTELCHSEHISASPFFNIFANVYVKPFTEEEAQNLIVSLLAEAGAKVRFTDEDVQSIFHFGGTHPYFLQVACYFLFDAYLENLTSSQKYIYLRKNFEGQVTLQLKDYWDKSNDQERIVLITLALLDRQKKIEGLSFHTKRLQALYEHSLPILAVLENRGLVISKFDKYSLFSMVFSEWICNEIINTIDDRLTCEEWLTSHRGWIDQVSSAVKKEVGEVFPKINSNYRELIVKLITDPKYLKMIPLIIEALLKLN